LPGRAYLRVVSPGMVPGRIMAVKGKGPLSTPAVSRAASLGPDAAPQVRPDAEETLRVILASLDDAKAEDTVTIDLHGKTSIGDYMVVPCGRSNRHVGAVADHVREDLEKAGLPDLRAAGVPHCVWGPVDARDLIV